MQGGMMIQGMGLIGSARQRKEYSTKDHLAENVRRMRQIQKKCKEKEEEAVKPVKPVWKSDRYVDVPSRIKQDLENPPPLRPASATFLRAHSRSSSHMNAQSSRPATPDNHDALSLSLSSAPKDVNLPHQDHDFIRVNGRNAKYNTMQRPSSASTVNDTKKRTDSALANYNMGQVPAYLKSRKKQWQKEEEERIANIPDPSMPPGHRTLPEHERLETLTLLQNKEKELLREFGALPIGVDTVRVHKRRKEVEGKLAELEEALRIFSRPKVFVKVDT